MKLNFGSILALIACLFLALSVPGHAADLCNTSPCSCIAMECAAATADPFPSVAGELNLTHSLTDSLDFIDKSTAIGGSLRVNNFFTGVDLVTDANYSFSKSNPFSVNDHWTAGFEFPSGKDVMFFAHYQDGFRQNTLYDGRVLIGAKLTFGSGRR